MPYSTYLKHQWLNQFRNVVGDMPIEACYASLHSANPGDTGASEISGGSPAYARIAITWNAAAGGAIDSLNTPVLNVPAGTTVSFVGFWDAATAGNWLAYTDVVDEVFAAQGTYTLTDADLDLNA